MKAKLGSNEDREYYQQYCKDGVNLTKLVSIQIILIIYILYMLKVILWNAFVQYIERCFYMIQSPPEILKDGLCPAILMPSKACKWEEACSKLTSPSPTTPAVSVDLLFLYETETHRTIHINRSSPSSIVTRRCLPALGTLKGGVVVVGNETTFTDGKGSSINATDVLEASKWVLFTVWKHTFWHFQKIHWIIRTSIYRFISKNEKNPYL